MAVVALPARLCVPRVQKPIIFLILRRRIVPISNMRLEALLGDTGLVVLILLVLIQKLVLVVANTDLIVALRLAWHLVRVGDGYLLRCGQRWKVRSHVPLMRPLGQLIHCLLVQDMLLEFVRAVAIAISIVDGVALSEDLATVDQTPLSVMLQDQPTV